MCVVALDYCTHKHTAPWAALQSPLVCATHSALDSSVCACWALVPVIDSPTVVIVVFVNRDRPLPGSQQAKDEGLCG